MVAEGTAEADLSVVGLFVHEVFDAFSTDKGVEGGDVPFFVVVGCGDGHGEGGRFVGG